MKKSIPVLLAAMLFSASAMACPGGAGSKGHGEHAKWGELKQKHAECMTAATTPEAKEACHATAKSEREALRAERRAQVEKFAKEHPGKAAEMKQRREERKKARSEPVARPAGVL